MIESLYVAESAKEKSLEVFMADYFKDGEYGEIKYTKYAPGTNWNYSNIEASLATYPALFTTKADFIGSQPIFNQIQIFFINSYTQIGATIFLFGFSGRIYFVANYLKYTCISA